MSEDFNLSSLKLYSRDLQNIPLLSYEEEQELGSKKDPQSINRLVEANLRLTFPLAQHYKNYGVDYEDLLQEGSLGLIHAAKLFDPSKKYRFCTYGVQWIRQYITRAIANQGRTIRVPVHLIENINKVRSAAAALTSELGRDPSDEEIAQKTELSVEKVIIAKSYLSSDLLSLDSPIDDDGEVAFGETLEDKKYLDPAIEYFKKDTTENIIEVLDTLSTRESDIIKKRFGIGTDKEATLEELGEEYNLTKERIRQIELKALRKLRHPARAAALKQCVTY